MLEYSERTHQLMQAKYQYELQDVAEPNLYREIFDYESIPKIAFNNRLVPINMPADIWMTDTTFRDGQQSVSPFKPEQIEHLFKLESRLGGPKGLIRQSEFFLYTDRDREALEQMVSYAQSGTCRWQLLLHYFGEAEDTVASCNTCDNCQRTRQLEASIPAPAEAAPPPAAVAPALLFSVGSRVRVPRHEEGEVIAIGSGTRCEDGKVIPLDVKVGDRILFGKWSGTEVKVGVQEYLVMKESDIMGIIDTKAA